MNVAGVCVRQSDIRELFRSGQTEKEINRDE